MPAPTPRAQHRGAGRSSIAFSRIEPGASTPSGCRPQRYTFIQRVRASRGSTLAGPGDRDHHAMAREWMLRTTALRAEFDVHLTKPIEASELVVVIARSC
jgi:hypothetical protein